MQKKQFISRVAEVLRANNARKPVSIPKQVFHISDDDGNKKDFTVKKTDKSVLYTVEDVSTILDACLSVVEDALKHGEEISIYGFGSLGVHQRAARATKRPDTGEWISIDARYVPKFNFGNTLRTAARIYEMSLNENFDEIAPFISDEDETDGD